MDRHASRRKLVLGASRARAPLAEPLSVCEHLMDVVPSDIRTHYNGGQNSGLSVYSTWYLVSVPRPCAARVAAPFIERGWVSVLLG